MVGNSTGQNMVENPKGASVHKWTKTDNDYISRFTVRQRRQIISESLEKKQYKVYNTMQGKVLLKKNYKLFSKYGIKHAFNRSANRKLLIDKIISLKRVPC